MSDPVDVAILGGGLAGLCLALQLKLAEPHRSVTIFERNKHPVPEAAHKVGESSVEIGAYYFDTIVLRLLLILIFLLLFMFIFFLLLSMFTLFPIFVLLPALILLLPLLFRDLLPLLFRDLLPLLFRDLFPVLEGAGLFADFWLPPFIVFF